MLLGVIVRPVDERLPDAVQLILGVGVVQGQDPVVVDLGRDAPVPGRRLDRVVLIVLLQVTSSSVGRLGQLPIDVLSLGQDL